MTWLGIPIVATDACPADLVAVIGPAVDVDGNPRQLEDRVGVVLKNLAPQ